MNVKINEVIIRYIECIKCSYERSCPIPEESPGHRFDWFCPECRTSLAGIIEPDGSVRVVFDPECSTTEDYILIEKNKDLIPWILVAQKHFSKEDKKRSTDLSAILYLFPVEIDKIKNPWGLPVFRAVSDND